MVIVLFVIAMHATVLMSNNPSHKRNILLLFCVGKSNE